MMSVDLLHLFIAIAEKGSISAGARAMSISPSLASRRLVTLEAELKCKLVQRGTRAFVLTDAGQLFLEWSRLIVSQFAEIGDQLEALQRNPVGSVSIACNEYIGPRYLPEIIKRFKVLHSGVSVRLTIIDDPLAMIDRGYDLVIHVGSIPPGNLIGRKIVSYRRVLCAAPSYLERQGVPKSVRDLAGHTCLAHSLVEPKNWYFRRRDGSVVVQTVTPDIQANSFPLLTELAIQGLGIVRVSERMASRAMSSGELLQVLSNEHCCDAEGQDPGVWVIYPDRHLSYRVRLFAEFLTAALKEFHSA